MEPRWSKIVLASKIINFISFQMWFHVKIKHQNIIKFFKIILFHFMMEPRLK